MNNTYKHNPDSAIHRIVIFSTFLKMFVDRFNRDISIHKIKFFSLILRFISVVYSFLSIFTMVKKIAIQWIVLSDLRTTGPR